MKYLTLLLVGLLSLSSQAEHCAQDFPNHFIMADGTLGLYPDGGAWWYPCSVSDTKNGVSPEACKSAFASYLSAKAQNKPVHFSFNGSCSEIGSGTSVNKGFSWFGVYWNDNN